MSSSTKQKDAAIRQFREITRASAQDAHRILKANRYNIEAATAAFFSEPATSVDKKADRESRDRLNALFDQFKDPDGPNITIEGAMSMCEHLSLSPEDVVFLPLSYYLRSPIMGTFTRAEYIDGWRILGNADTIHKQIEALDRLREELRRNAPIRIERLALENKATSSTAGLYTKVYEYTYAFARPEGQKSLPLDTALAFWDLILPHSPTFQREGSSGTFTQAQLSLWKRFLSENTGGRAVSKDTWTQFLDFTNEIDPDFNNHDFDAAWPSVIDDFVEWAREHKADAPSGNRMDTS